MTSADCAWARDRAEELALGVLDGAERAEVLHHVSACAGCRRLVQELTQVADALPHVAPEAEPPPGFEHRVLARIRGDRARKLRRRAMVLASTAAAAAILAVATVRIVDATRDSGTTNAAPTLHTVPMTGADGLTVGRVAVSRGARAQLAVDVDYAVPAGEYALELRAGGDQPTRLGTLRVADGHGEWTGRAELPRRGDATVAMIDGAGAVVCSADLRPSAR
jgi:anti-sigma-K factor RskA